MIKAILIDDESHCLETLSILLEAYCPEVQIIESCCSGKSGIEAIKKLNPDVVFLDIQMPGINGFQLLEKLDTISFAIIFTTSYDQYAIKAIHFSALDYLLKPIDAKELIAAVRKVQIQKKLPGTAQFELLFDRLQQKENSFKKIAIPTLEGFELIETNQIITCNADDNYTELILKGNKTILASRSLKDFEGQLKSFSNFIRVHHSHMVNLNEVKKYIRGQGGYLIMSDNSTVNVSRSRKQALLELLS